MLRFYREARRKVEISGARVRALFLGLPRPARPWRPRGRARRFVDWQSQPAPL